MTERPTDDEAALREAVERLEAVKRRWHGDMKWLRANNAREHVREVKSDADALALVLRRVRETMKEEG